MEDPSIFRVSNGKSMENPMTKWMMKGAIALFQDTSNGPTLCRTYLDQDARLSDRSQQERLFSPTGSHVPMAFKMDFLQSQVAMAQNY